MCRKQCGTARRRQRLDLGCARPRHETCPLLVCQQPRRWRGISFYARSGRTAGASCPIDNRWPQAYLTAVEDAFGADIDYATGEDLRRGAGGEVRYSPAQCMGARKAAITGSPDKAHISTSHTERQNLTMRMQMRRFTRLTNAFSKKIENHEAAIALHYMHYNFARVHQTLRVTPAMEAGIANHVWTLEEIVGLLG